MLSKYLTIAVLLVVFAWSVVMTALGQTAAVGALVPSLILLVQHAVQALSGDARRAEPASAATDASGGDGAGGSTVGAEQATDLGPLVPAVPVGAGSRAGEEAAR